jgi:hypothetical protein
MMAEYLDPDVFVALDESAVDDKTGQCRYGRSPAGQPCVQRMTFLRGVRHSILPALTTKGVIALDIFEGSVTKERFLSFMREHVVCATAVYPIVVQFSSRQKGTPAKPIPRQEKRGDIRQLLNTS